MLATYTDTLPLSLRRKHRLRKAKAWGQADVQFMELPGATIRYRIVGNDGPVLVICPDPPVMIEHYNELAKRLSRHFRVVLFELPAFGFSIPKLGFSMQPERILEVVSAFLHKLAMGPYILSFPCVAGLTAVHLAHEHPQLVSALVLTQTPDKANALHWKHGRDPKGILHTPVLGQVALSLLKRKRMTQWFAAALADKSQTEQYASLCESAFDHGACFCLASGFQQYLTEKLPELGPVHQPVLVIWGSKDSSHADTDKHSTLSFAPGAEFRVFAEAGHFPDLEDPDQFQECLVRLVRRLDTRNSWPN